MHDGITAGLVNYGIEGGGGLKITLCDDYFHKPGLPIDAKLARWNSHYKKITTAWKNVKNKFSEEKRRSIFFAVSSSEDKADLISSREFPDIYDQGDQVRDTQVRKKRNSKDELFTKYKNEFARKYHISDDAIEGIRSEGMLFHWPEP